MISHLLVLVGTTVLVIIGLMMTSSATATTAATAMMTSSSKTAIIIKNCSDTVKCSTSSCNKILTVPFNKRCVPMTPAVSNLLLPGKFLTVVPISAPALCSPTEVFFGDPTCNAANISSVFMTVDSTCLQYSPRLQTARVIDDQFRVFVQSCKDPNCRNCEPLSPSDKGLPPGECYAHPGVPGLFLKYPNLESCTSYNFVAFEDEQSCVAYDVSKATATTLLAGQGSCFNGVSLDFV